MGRRKNILMKDEEGGIQKEVKEIDGSKTPLQRTMDYLSKVENPFSFNMQGYHVELEWTNTEITLQNRLVEMLASS